MDIAVQFDHPSVVREMLLLGVDPNARRSDGVTQLHVAAQMGFTEVVQVLVENGAGVDVVSEPGGFTPLLSAVAAEHLEVVKELLRLGASVSAVDRAGLTPLMLAATLGKMEILQELVAHGADIKLYPRSRVCTSPQPVHQCWYWGVMLGCPPPPHALT
jgi:ankyrin repeat protein